MIYYFPGILLGLVKFPEKLIYLFGSCAQTVHVQTALQLKKMFSESYKVQLLN